MKQESFDFLSIGSGLAGLTFAIQAAKHGRVCVLTKAELFDANTSYAQGGIAAAVGETDSWKLHEEDTLRAGAGLGNPEAVRFLVQQAPKAIEWLLSIGAAFDREEDELLQLSREAGHSRNRIVHHADRTGWEVERAVVEAVRGNPNIKLYENAFVTELIMREGRCVGAIAQIQDVGERVFLARATMLATGGCGRLYQHTTNPRVATGDGLALAARAGAKIEGMEFMQFHPTTLYHPQLRSFLITEALRGAGATLRNHLGTRFMYDYDPRLELAPRDVVARAIDEEMKKRETWCVYLDATHLEPYRLKEDFPTIWKKLAEVGIEMHKDWIPVVPAQHYSCGGVATDLHSQTSLSGLFAAGEVAHTGVHGANRLASNSLLEALVFAMAGAEAVQQSPPVPEFFPQASPLHSIAESEAVRLRRNLQKLMTAEAGIVRTATGLKKAKNKLEALKREYLNLPEAPYSQYSLETFNLFIVAGFVIEGALARKENVGLHYVMEEKPLPV